MQEVSKKEHAKASNAFGRKLEGYTLTNNEEKDIIDFELRSYFILYKAVLSNQKI